MRNIIFGSILVAQAFFVDGQGNRVPNPNGVQGSGGTSTNSIHDSVSSVAASGDGVLFWRKKKDVPDKPQTLTTYESPNAIVGRRKEVSGSFEYYKLSNGYSCQLRLEASIDDSSYTFNRSNQILITLPEKICTDLGMTTEVKTK